MSEEQKEKGMGKYFFRASAEDFKKIPGSPIAYWLTPKLRSAFQKFISFSKYSDTRIGLITGDNNYYIRQWYEISFNQIGFNFNREQAKDSAKKWFPQSKGGDFRKWYGNNYTVLNWANDGYELQNRPHSSGHRILAHNFNLDKIFQEGITWTKISSSNFAVRFQPKGFLFNDASANAFPYDKSNTNFLIAFLVSKLPIEMLKAMNPTLNFLPGDIANLVIPPIELIKSKLSDIANFALLSSKSDWDSYETSWDFTTLPLLEPQYRQDTLEATYSTLRAHWHTMTQEMLQFEEENNRIFIDAYGLQDELTPDVPLKEITLTCNPHYRYGGDKTDAELEALLLADTMRELISYAVGCMFGRYSLDKPGLILANQGETLADYQYQVPNTRFPADDNNVIPMLDNDWFADDITQRFREFLQITFGKDNYEENLNFITQALNIGDKRNYSLRDYFLKEFYNDHLKRYKKRPIYWLFTSPKGGFNALIYMHRYRSDTVSVVLNDYLREFRAKQAAHKANLEHIQASASSSPAEKTRALKEIEKVSKLLSELDEYERDILYPLATEQLEIDLDDGVKVNYPKFGTALKKISGLEAKED